jgi:hypothetical protein
MGGERSYLNYRQFTTKDTEGHEEKRCAVEAGAAIEINCIKITW